MSPESPQYEYRVLDHDGTVLTQGVHFTIKAASRQGVPLRVQRREIGGWEDCSDES